MARIGSANHDLGMWLDGENPGAGAQDADSLGLNGNVWKLDRITSKLAADGALAAAAVLPANLDATVVDGVTLAQDGATKKLEVKDLGIAAAQIAADAVETLKIKDLNVTNAKIANATIEYTKLAPFTITDGELAVNSVLEGKIADAAVTAAKISHDNGRTKVVLTFGIDGATKYGTHHGFVTTAACGVPMRLAGAITGGSAITAAGVQVVVAQAYAAAGATHFAAGSKITVLDDGTGLTSIRINGAASGVIIGGANIPDIVSVDIELD